MPTFVRPACCEPRKGLRGGHIPGSVNIPFSRVLTNGRYQSPAALKALFDRFDLGEKPLVFRCGSGVTACTVLLAAAGVLQNLLSLYDGAWTERAQREDLPVA